MAEKVAITKKSKFLHSELDSNICFQEKSKRHLIIFFQKLLKKSDLKSLIEAVKMQFGIVSQLSLHLFNPFMPVAAKSRWRFRLNLSDYRIFGKIFEGVMFTRTQPTVLLQIFCESMIDSKVIFKSIKSSARTWPIFFLSIYHPIWR